MANRVRGERSIEIGGKRYTLRPSYEALAAIEDEFDLPLIKVAVRLVEWDLKVSGLSALVDLCIVDDPKPSRDEIGEALLAMGLPAAVDLLDGFLGAALAGPETDSEKKTPVKRKKSTVNTHSAGSRKSQPAR